MPDSSTASFAESQPLIGRDAELHQAVDMINRRGPALVVVEAEVGMGKTTFLCEAQARAREMDWRTVPRDLDNTLTISADTTEGSFWTQVSNWAMASRQGPSPGWGSSSPSSLGTEVGAKRSANPSELAVRQGVASERTPTSQVALDPLVELLAGHSPVLLSVDGYRPGQEFADWFEGRFIADVKKLTVPVVVIVANEPSTMETLRSNADLTITLGPLDRAAVRTHLESIGREVSPAMTEAELHVYVDQTSERPDLLGSLTRVLTLAKTH